MVKGKEKAPFSRPCAVAGTGENALFEESSNPLGGISRSGEGGIRAEHEYTSVPQKQYTAFRALRQEKGICLLHLAN